MTWARNAHDFEKRVNFLYRAEVRREFLYAPMQRATGVSHGEVMDRMDKMSPTEALATTA